jgi:hypothetical protein
MARQKDLPGMTDRKIKDLHEKAEEYADVRDQRQALTPKEVALKAELLSLMKKHKLDKYAYNGVEVERITEEETVKVRIRKPDAGGDE